MEKREKRKAEETLLRKQRKNPAYIKQRKEDHAKLCELLEKAELPPPPTVTRLVESSAFDYRRGLETTIEETRRSIHVLERKVEAMTAAKEEAYYFECRYFRK